MRPQHVKDMLLCRESASDFLTALTAFVNMALAGRCPADVLWRTSDRTEQEIRRHPPCCCRVHTETPTCANTHAAAYLATYFKPIQLRVKSQGGCEAAVHSARRFLESMPPDNILVKLDFSNAFNSLHRLDMLQCSGTVFHSCLRTAVQPIQLHMSYFMVVQYCHRKDLSRETPSAHCFSVIPSICCLSH